MHIYSLNLSLNFKPKFENLKLRLQINMPCNFRTPGPRWNEFEFSGLETADRWLQIERWSTQSRLATLLSSWLSFVVSNCEFVAFQLVSWVRCGAWLYRFLIVAPLLTRSIWKVLSMEFISVTNLQTLSYLVSFWRAIFLLCYSTNLMRMLWCKHEKYYCEYMYCLYTWKRKISVENITFYLWKSVQSIKNSSWN